MSLVDTLLARRSVMFTSPRSPAECRDRIGPNSTPSVFGSGADGTSPFIVNWRGDSEVTLTKPWSKWTTRRRPHCSLRVRFEAQSDGTFVEVATGVAPSLVLSFTLLWLFFAAYALLILTSARHSPGGNPLVALAFCGFLGPLLWFSARSTVVRQAPDLLSTLEGVLGAVSSPAF
jgi:hypothetical protein